ncbi:Smr/MutS family protein [Castellaniella sp.]|uniref:Smr/MutS family protein n=1 Tax=Castellaniella sp. TaxID=1955812 RepID=UPI003C72B8AF
MKDSKSTLSDLRQLQAGAKQAATHQSTKPAATQPRGNSLQRTSGTGANPPAGAVSSTVAILDAEDRALFKQAVRLVRPLANHGPRSRTLTLHASESQLQARREHAQGGPEAPRPAFGPSQQAEAAYRFFNPDDQAFLRHGCGPDLLRGLRRNKWPSQATLDLHGNSQEQAAERLDRFLDSCLTHQIRCVRIVHGKGIGSRGEPILKAFVRQHLCRLSAVQAWIECAERDGGSGAVSVLLRTPKESRHTREAPSDEY